MKLRFTLIEVLACVGVVIAFLWYACIIAIAAGVAYWVWSQLLS